ncbi:MAG: 30S ribosomal protein S5 alanine N-acetyltransferase, partial [Rhodomicrobium sp.]
MLGARMFFSDSRPYVEGDGVYLREPQMSDYKTWAALRSQSRAFLEPWEPRWSRDELTRDTYRRRIRYYYRDARQ